MDIEEFIESSNNIDSVDCLIDLYSEAMQQFAVDQQLQALADEYPALDQSGSDRDGGQQVKSSPPDELAQTIMENSPQFSTQQNPGLVDSVKALLDQNTQGIRWESPQTIRHLSKDRVEDTENFPGYTACPYPLNQLDKAINVFSTANSGSQPGCDTTSLDKLNLITYQFYTCYCRLEGQSTIEDETPQLTGQELEILRCSAHGLSRTDIAEKLKISAHTVDFHIRNLFRKLNVVNITHAVATALKLQLIHI